MVELKSRTRTKIVPMNEKVIGCQVVNLQNQVLGRIADWVVDLGASRIVYAVLCSRRFLRIEDEYFAVGSF